MSIVVNARGLACPQPLIAAKKALEGIEDGVVTVIVDNGAARENVLKFAAGSGHRAQAEARGGDCYIRIVKGGGAAPAAGEEPAPAGGPLVYLITRATLGDGDDTLGAVLMKSFFYALLESRPRPQAILFLNGGVHLAASGSPALGYLTRLADEGVTILSCGACLDFYGLKDKLRAGGVTNMYCIVETAAAAGKVVTL